MVPVASVAAKWTEAEEALLRLMRPHGFVPLDRLSEAEKATARTLAGRGLVVALGIEITIGTVGVVAFALTHAGMAEAVLLGGLN
jgi:hypothetical protein